MYTIQTLNKISPAGTSLFDPAVYTVTDTAQNPDAIMVRSASMHEMEFSDQLLAIARAGAGVNNIPVADCAQKGICVFNTPGANANAVKELVLTGLLLSSRKITQGMQWAATLKEQGDQVGKLVEKGKSQFVGPEIQGKTLGIIGLGAIGALVANAAIALGMQVVGTDPFLSVGAALRLNPAVRVVGTREAVFAAADYLTIHVPCNADTKGMINQETIALMKDGVRVLNYARGELVNDDDMLVLAGANRTQNHRIKLEYLQVTSGVGVRSVASLGLNISGEKFEAAASGNGPVDAAIKALKKIIDRHMTLKEFTIQAISKGSDDMGKVPMQVEYDHHIYYGFGANTDIIAASVEAYIDCINKFKM